MIDGIEPFYRQIADSIQAAIPEEWNSAKMEAIFYSGHSQYLGEYTRKSDGRSRSFATGRNGEGAFREIRRKFKEAGKPLWGSACFEIESCGKFNLGFCYENCDEQGNTYFDEDEEVRRGEERDRRLTAQ